MIAAELNRSSLLLQIVRYIATDVLPNLRQLLLDNDKTLTACNNIVYYIVNPAMKSRTRYVHWKVIVCNAC
jgi:hypothetical protein